MDRIIPSLLFVVSILISQGTLAQVRLGLKAGANASNIHTEAATFDPLLGYQAGLIADLGLSTHFSIQPALLVNSKGFRNDVDLRDKNGQRIDGVIAVYSLIYTEIPVLLLYKGNLGKKCRWYGGLGPYAGIGITGKFKTGTDFREDERIKFTAGKQSTSTGIVFQRMDYGLSAATGVEKGKIQFGINYSYGLTSVNPEDRTPNVGKTYNRTLAVTVGYWFGKFD